MSEAETIDYHGHTLWLSSCELTEDWLGAVYFPQDRHRWDESQKKWVLYRPKRFSGSTREDLLAKLTACADSSIERRAWWQQSEGATMRKPRELDHYVLTVVTEKNPKRKGSLARDRFKLYRSGMTIGEFLAAGGTYVDIIWDEEHGYIKIDREVQL